MMYFSTHWQLLKRQKNIIQVQITFLNEEGVCEKHVKFYEEWIGLCTKDIDSVVSIIHEHFPNYKVLYKEICQAKKVLPYFNDRLINNKLDYESEPFYKLYTNACHKDIARFLKTCDVSYFKPDEWLTRIYVDLCTQYDTYSFYYKWYNIRNDVNGLVESLEMVPDRKDQPDWTFAAFDLETVPLEGNHIPIGYHESDRIVMISVFKWNKRYGTKKWLLYLLPEGGKICRPDNEVPFNSESEMLVHFHSLLEDVQVLTGYNINAYDFPCIFARLIWLKLTVVLKHYTSFKVGSDLIVNYNNKIVVDLYTYFKTFSGYNLPSFKLDDVARVKLTGETKLQVKSTGIWSWYRNPLAVQLLEEQNVETCFNILKPETVSKPIEFGTFGTYLDYCLKDSELVYRLFEKEYVMSFLVERANFTALNAIEVLHYGNSRYLLELFKTYGLRLGYFVNPNFLDYDSKYESLFKGKTYQGALNFCNPEMIYEDVSVMDFVSMYPSALLSSNLCYGTCTIMTREEWLSNEAAQELTCIPYREHSDVDFANDIASSQFSYPTFNPKVDEFAIVINTKTEAFLPQIVKHFIDLRKFHQNKWKQTKDVYHYNVQLGIKILINSLYGIMANKDSCLAYLPIAMTIVTLSRYQLLGSYHYLKSRGYDVCYADTDSLFVHKWPVDQCDEVNAFLNLPHVELKYEQRMKRFLILSKKRYIYEQLSDNVIVTKGFQKKINGIVEFMTKKILTCIWNSIFEDETPPTESDGWIVWVDTILEANYMCRDPKKYSIYRKIKSLDEYKSSSCPSVKFLKKYPDKKLEHVELTYSRADVAVTEASNWIMDVEDCQCVNYEQLFINQKKIFYTLLNMAYWKQPNSEKVADMVLNNLHWKKFVHAELLHWHATGRRIVMLTEPGVKYTFTMNDHLKTFRKRGRKRKLEI